MTWVDDVISEGESILADFSREKAAYYISRSLSLLSDCGVEKQRAGMQTQKQRVGRISARGSWSTPGPDDDDYLEDAKTLVLRFKRIKAEIESGEKGAGGTVFNIDAHSENANTANASATAMATMSYAGACAAVDGLDLDEDEKDELIDLLNDARKAKGDKNASRCCRAGFDRECVRVWHRDPHSGLAVRVGTASIRCDLLGRNGALGAKNQVVFKSRG